MNRNRVTVRYAKAFVELASEEGIVMACYNDMGVLFASLDSFRGFHDFVISPELSAPDKMKLMSRFFGNDFQQLTLRFIELIFEKYREEYLIDICRNCIDMFRQMEGISSANLTTAYELDQEIIGQIRTAFEQKTKRTVELTTNTDPTLIGGFIFTIDGEQYDASIASRLLLVKKQLQI
jgi:F-type H+-transporting ATPase subunit delta